MGIGRVRAVSRRFRTALGAALLLLLPAAASAQSEPPSGTGSTKLLTAPAEKYAMAPGGVDMRTGRYVYSENDLAIGGEDGLALARITAPAVRGHVNPFANFSHAWDVMLTEKRVNIFEGNDSHNSGQDFRINVHFGGRSETFQSRTTDYGFIQLSRGAFASLTFAGDRAGPNVVYTFQAADGTVATFRPLGGGDCSDAYRCAYVSQIVDPDGTRLSFDYANDGGAGGAHLRAVTSSRGYLLLFEHLGGNLVSRACVINLAVTPRPADNLCPAGAPAANYSYVVANGATRLASVASPSGRTSGFTYGSANGVATMGFVKPGATAPWLTNLLGGWPDEDGMTQEIVGAQTFADGQSYNYYFEPTPDADNRAPSIAGGWFEDGAGDRTSLDYEFPALPRSFSSSFTPDQPNGGYPYVNYGDVVLQATSGPVTVTDPLGRVTTNHYCDPAAEAGLPLSEHQRCIVTLLQWTIDPDGIKTVLSYDGWRNVREVRRKSKDGSLPDIVTSAAYACINPKSCAKPTSFTDPNLKTTDYTYAPEHGGVLTETGPAVPTRQADGSIADVRPQKRYIYALRHAWIRDPLGGSGYVQAEPGTWLLTGESFCRTSAATGNPASPCARIGDEVATVYDYGPDSGPNTLMLRGTAVTADGATLRTCYAYDERGYKVSETGPGANLASCPASAPAAAAAYTTSYRYDADGRQTGTISPDPDGAGPLTFPAVRNTYDSAGQLQTVEQGELAGRQCLRCIGPKDRRGGDRDRYGALDDPLQLRQCGPACLHRQADEPRHLLRRVQCLHCRPAGRLRARPDHSQRLRQGRAAPPGARGGRHRG
jgi:hypothetical protein